MVFFHFFSIFNSAFSKLTVETDQTPHSVAPDLGLHCLPMSHKDARLIYGLN